MYNIDIKWKKVPFLTIRLRLDYGSPFPTIRNPSVMTSYFTQIRLKRQNVMGVFLVVLL